MLLSIHRQKKNNKICNYEPGYWQLSSVRIKLEVLLHKLWHCAQVIIIQAQARAEDCNKQARVSLTVTHWRETVYRTDLSWFIISANCAESIALVLSQRRIFVGKVWHRLFPHGGQERNQGLGTSLHSSRMPHRTYFF